MPEGQRHLTHGDGCQIGALKESGLSGGAVAARPGRDRAAGLAGAAPERRGFGLQPRRGAGEGGGAPRRGIVCPEEDDCGAPGACGDVPDGGLEPRADGGTAASGGGWAVGRQWIYEHLKADRKAGGGLFPLLRRRGKKPNWRGGRHSGRGHIPGRVDISERPDEVESRERVGDWEADTIIGKGHSGAVVPLVDRALRYTYLQRVDRRTSAAVSAAMLAMLRPSAVPVHTITADNGREFAGHAGVAKALQAGFFFATPYHFWERGLNGHTGGTCRRGRTCGRSATMRWDGCRTARTRDRAGCSATGRPPRCSTGPALPDTAGPPPANADGCAGRGWTGFRRRVRPGSGRAALSLRPDGRDPPRRRPCAARKAPIGSPAKGLQPSRARNHRRQGAGNPAFRPFSPPGRGKWPVLHFRLEVGTDNLCP